MLFRMNPEIQEIIRLVRQILPFRWYIILFTVGSGFIAWYLTQPHIKKPEYRSTAIMLPPNTASAKSVAFLKQEFGGYKIATFDQMLQLQAAIASEDAMWHMVKKFNLWDYYRLKGIQDPHTREKFLRDIYFDRLSVFITRRASLHVSMLDENPDTARAMTNELVEYARTFTEKIAKRKTGVTYIHETQKKLQEVQDSLGLLANAMRKKYNIFRYDDVSDLLTPKMINRKTFLENYDRLISLENRRRDIDIHINQVKFDINARREHIAQHPSLVHLAASGVSSPIIIRPNRWLIVPFTMFTALISGIIIIALLREWFFKNTD